jgi:hypothetical protein
VSPSFIKPQKISSWPILSGASEKFLCVALSVTTITNVRLLMSPPPTSGQQRPRALPPQRRRVDATTTASIGTSMATTGVAIRRQLPPPISTPLASGEATLVPDLLVWTTDRWSSRATPSEQVHVPPSPGIILFPKSNRWFPKLINRALAGHQ